MIACWNASQMKHLLTPVTNKIRLFKLHHRFRIIYSHFFLLLFSSFEKMKLCKSMRKNRGDSQSIYFIVNFTEKERVLPSFCCCLIEFRWWVILLSLVDTILKQMCKLEPGIIGIVNLMRSSFFGVAAKNKGEWGAAAPLTPVRIPPTAALFVPAKVMSFWWAYTQHARTNKKTPLHKIYAYCTHGKVELIRSEQK